MESDDSGKGHTHETEDIGAGRMKDLLSCLGSDNPIISIRLFALLSFHSPESTADGIVTLRFRDLSETPCIGAWEGREEGGR
jgi:aryl carrier-like protein